MDFFPLPTPSLRLYDFWRNGHATIKGTPFVITVFVRIEAQASIPFQILNIWCQNEILHCAYSRLHD